MNQKSSGGSAAYELPSVGATAAAPGRPKQGPAPSGGSAAHEVASVGATKHIVDSSGWLEVLVDGPNAPVFLEVITQGHLVVPAITVFEVTKRARLLGTAADAQRIESHMRRFEVADLTADRASAAAAVSLKHKLPMADSLIYAAALEFDALVWTQDNDFEHLPQVRFLAKAKAQT